METEVVKAYPRVAWRESLAVAETPAQYVFHRPRLYLETTIPSLLTARPSRDLEVARLQKITERWWNSWRTQFEIYVSDAVIREARAGDPYAARRRMSIIDRFPVLKKSHVSEALKQAIIKGTHLPRQAATDAEHVALAATSRVAFLVTWNCAHLVNKQFAREIATVCWSEGFLCPRVCTPEQLMGRYEHVKTG